MKINKNFASFFPLLLKALKEVDGDVLELGTGLFSTPLLNWICFSENRKLVSYENSETFYNMMEHCNSDFHKVILIDDWDEADIERDWGVVLVDHKPAIRRKEDVKRLANYAQCIVLHDTQGRSNIKFHFDEIYPLFKYKISYSKAKPHSSALSNFVDVTKWQKL